MRLLHVGLWIGAFSMAAAQATEPVAPSTLQQVGRLITAAQGTELAAQPVGASAVSVELPVHPEQAKPLELKLRSEQLYQGLANVGASSLTSTSTLTNTLTNTLTVTTSTK